MIKSFGMSATALVAIGFACTASVVAVAADTPSTAENPAASMKLTDAQCQTLWGQAMGEGSGDLSSDKAKPYVNDFAKADTDSNGKLSQSEWSAACSQGWVKTADSGPASEPAGTTSDRTPAGASERTPGAGTTGAAGTDAGKTSEGTSDRTPTKP